MTAATDERLNVTLNARALLIEVDAAKGRGLDAMHPICIFAEHLRTALDGTPPATTSGAVTIWTATTDGDNCPVTTTVHTSRAEAEERVRDDLDDKIDATGMTGDRLHEAWSDAYDGACIIEEHEVTLTPVAPATYTSTVSGMAAMTPAGAMAFWDLTADEFEAIPENLRTWLQGLAADSIKRADIGKAITTARVALEAIAASGGDKEPDDGDYDDMESAHSNGCAVAAWEAAEVARKALLALAPLATADFESAVLMERQRCAEIARTVTGGPIYFVGGRPNVGAVLGGDIIAQAIMAPPGLPAFGQNGDELRTLMAPFYLFEEGSLGALAGAARSCMGSNDDAQLRYVIATIEGELAQRKRTMAVTPMEPEPDGPPSKCTGACGTVGRLGASQWDPETGFCRFCGEDGNA